MSSPTKVTRLSEEAKTALQAIKPSDRFAKMGGWAPIPNLVLDIHNKVSGHAQFILVQEIMHRTFGAPGTPEWALVKLRHLEAKTPYCRKAFELAADDAVARGLIERKRAGRSSLFRVVPEDWENVPDYIGRVAPVITEEQRHPITGRFHLAKGKFLPMSDLHIADPAAVRFVHDVQTAQPLEVSLEVQADGLISIVIRDESQGEEIANQLPLHSPIVRHSFASDLTPIFLNLFGKVPDSAFAAKIEDACDGAPLENLLDRIDEKRRSRALKKSGLVLELARDVGAAWRATAAERAKAAAAAAAADEARAGQRARDHRFSEAMAAAVGDTLDEYRRISGKSTATTEDWRAAGDQIAIHLFDEA